MNDMLTGVGKSHPLGQCVSHHPANEVQTRWVNYNNSCHAMTIMTRVVFHDTLTPLYDCHYTYTANKHWKILGQMGPGNGDKVMTSAGLRMRMRGILFKYDRIAPQGKLSAHSPGRAANNFIIICFNSKDKRPKR